MIVLKLIGGVLLGLLGLLILICLASVRITLGMKGDFYWRISVFGIPIPSSLFLGKAGKRSSGAKKSRRKSSKKKSKSSGDVGKSEEKEKKPLGDTLSLIFSLCGEALRLVPKAFRIRLHRLDVRVGGSEAADVALTYGRLYAILEGGLALLDGYRGTFYGFRARRDKISITVDYSGVPTRADFKVTISCFVWQLLNVAVRLGIRYVLRSLNGGDEETDSAKEAHGGMSVSAGGHGQGKEKETATAARKDGRYGRHTD